MINYVKGLVKYKTEQSITIDLGSIGFECAIANGTRYEIGSEVTLYLYLHWNPEQGPSLYAFQSTLEKTIFLLIISCSGIGPKIGLAVLADMGAEGFIEAIEMGNERALSKVSGIGPKKAEHMMVQLKHKVAQLIKSGIELGKSGHITQWQTVSEALESLNYSRVEINRAMSYLKSKAVDTNISFDQLMRQALSYLAKQPR